MCGIFEDSEDQDKAPWRETLKMQKEEDAATFRDPRRIALTLFASSYKDKSAESSIGKDEDALPRLIAALYDSGFFARFIVEDAPKPMRDWSANTYETISLLVAGLFKECRDVM